MTKSFEKIFQSAMKATNKSLTRSEWMALLEHIDNAVRMIDRLIERVPARKGTYLGSARDKLMRAATEVNDLRPSDEE